MKGVAMNREDAISELKRQAPNFLDSARKRGYVCPSCGNGTGRDGDGIVRIPQSSSYKCFKCGYAGDVIDLVGVTYGLDNFNDQLEKACELYNIDLDHHSNNNFSRNNKKSSEKKKKEVINSINSIDQSVAEEEDLSSYYKECYDRVSKTSYYKKRGIGKDLIDRFQLGFDAAFRYGEKIPYLMMMAILPTSKSTYEARNIDSDEKFRYFKHGSARIFNESILETEKEKPIYVCEGIFDALSIIQTGEAEAIALGSAINYRLLLNKLDKTVPSKPLVLLLDADETGRKNENKLIEELTKRNIPYYQGMKAIEGYHDPNDRLVKDPEGLKQSVRLVNEEVYKIPSAADIAKEEYLNTSAGRSLSQFSKMIIENADRPRFSTGFDTIDDILQGGLFTGLYVIGAISSLGKTTLTLQIADNLAKQGRDVLFFSLEQSKFDLMSKSISRETYMYCRRNHMSDKYARSNIEIIDGRKWRWLDDIGKNVVNESMKEYGDYANHVFIYEGIGNISVDDIREKVKNHSAITGNKRPIVFIDYLQILAPNYTDLKNRATDKQIVDHNITALKRLSRDYDLPIVAVSSLNRHNYAEKINMAAFKESGAIEYGSDVLIGLQLTGAGEKDFDVDEEKSKNPREIDFCILKNRNGRITTNGIPLLYYPVFNCFIQKNNRPGKDGFMRLTKEQEDQIPF